MTEGIPYVDQPRCAWCGQDPLYIAYHDLEWGRPLHDDRALFELMILEGAQAGLSWITILKKREGYRRLFDHFDAEKVAAYDEQKVTQLLSDPGIVRNRLKVRSAITNARVVLDLREEFGSLDHYFWRYVDGQPIQNHWTCMDELPASTPLSDTISKDLKKRGLRFFGTTICYAFMQSIGLVNDHTTNCFLYGD